MEIWKDIKDFPLYQVSSHGRVRNKNSGRILSPCQDHGGYWRVCLSKSNQKFQRGIHRLVAENFIENTNDKNEIDHINRIRTDNRIENLRWVTRSENNSNRILTKVSNTGEKNICSCKNGYVITIKRNRQKQQKWATTLEEAIKIRDELKEIF